MMIEIMHDITYTFQVAVSVPSFSIPLFVFSLPPWRKTSYDSHPLRAVSHLERVADSPECRSMAGRSRSHALGCDPGAKLGGRA